MRLGFRTGVIILVHLSVLTELLNAQNQYQPQQNQQKEEQIVLEINSRDRAAAQMFVAIGDSATILCQNSAQFDYCRFVVPDQEQTNQYTTLVLSEKFPSIDPNFEYIGNGLQSGQCGIKIRNVHEKYNGNITCTAAVGPNELSGLINLFIARPPLEPLIEQEGAPNRNGFEVGQRMIWKCIVKNGRPPAQIQWFIKNDEQYLPINSMNPRHRLETQEDFPNQLFSSSQELEKMIEAEDDGKFLVCRSTHDSTRTVNEAQLQLLVRYAPTGQREVDIYGLQLEKSNSFTVQIKANPRPRVEWKIDGDIIEERGTRDHFIAPELQQVGPNLYNATLTIAPLMVEDLTKTYYLSAFNDIGRADFSVRISSTNTPAEGLEIGAIVGIVIVLAILFIVIILIIFARVSKKWCFARASLNTDISPDSEAQIQHNDELDTKEEYDGGENLNQQSEEVTPPVTDKLESQKKADIKKTTNGQHQNGTKPPASSASEIPDEFQYTKNDDNISINLNNVGGGDPNVSLLTSNETNFPHTQNNYVEDDDNHPPERVSSTSICCGLFQKKNNNNIQYTLTTNHEFFDSANTVYSPTTISINKDEKNSRKKRLSSPQIKRPHIKDRLTQNRTASYVEAVGISRISDLQRSPQFQQNSMADVEIIKNDISDSSNNPNKIMTKTNKNILLNELNNHLENKNKIEKSIKYKQQHPPDVIATGLDFECSSRDSKFDLLTQGNEIGIPGVEVTSIDSLPESRCSKWIPKNQRELLEKQARILSNMHNSPPILEKPFSKTNSSYNNVALTEDDLNEALSTTMNASVPITVSKFGKETSPRIEAKLFETEI